LELFSGSRTIVQLRMQEEEVVLGMALEDGERVRLPWSLYTLFLLPEEFELMRFLESNIGTAGAIEYRASNRSENSRSTPMNVEEIRESQIRSPS